MESWNVVIVLTRSNAIVAPSRGYRIKQIIMCYSPDNILPLSLWPTRVADYACHDRSIQQCIMLPDLSLEYRTALVSINYPFSKTGLSVLPYPDSLPVKWSAGRTLLSGRSFDGNLWVCILRMTWHIPESKSRVDGGSLLLLSCYKRAPSYPIHKILNYFCT